MADFDFKVHDQAFRHLGVKPVIDEDMYGEMIDQHAPSAPHLDVDVIPSVLWNWSKPAQRLHSLLEGDAILPIGGYGSNKHGILLPAMPDTARTNKLLRHETKHFFDDANGDSQDSASKMQSKFRGSLALAAAGIGVGLIRGNKSLVVPSALSPLVLLPAAYWNAPHERAARQFAEDKEIEDRYGRIITYKPL